MVGQGEVDRGRVGRPTATARVRLSITHVYIHIIVNAQRARIQGHECIVTMYLDYNSHVHNYTYQACSTICIAMYVNSLSKWLTSYVLAHLLRITMHSLWTKTTIITHVLLCTVGCGYKG